ncbi:hypothetical protein BV22DRAFT_323970 [Leucogyrophana mollusca]|uniref:Uncharacterized protein n=1 Tax=Leucogyrophana mollusca TaxID=85980 RepID=A0ACB8BNR6_9AGAM|nr:hypothetical protein BV22DRAFT_323970 [Leucogyrophana mollusca]
MPYTSPDAARRPRSKTTSFTEERGPGAFATLGALPRRAPSSSSSAAKFHIRSDDDDESSSPESPVDERPRPNLKLDTLQPPATVPFPRSSSPSSPLAQPPCSSPRPLLSRGNSTPILLSNGKPLKSSLKSSCSSPSITSTSSTSASPPQSQSPTPTNHLHLRARSEPTTPTPKNVHFPDRDDNLTTVRLFNRTAKPAALSSPLGDDTETETENPPDHNDRFPFPVLPAPPTFEIDPAASSPVPAQRPSPHAHVHIESLVLGAGALGRCRQQPHLAGTLLVRNLAYEKHVAVRFTLDDWQTVSEVSARHVVSLNALPDALAHPSATPTASSSSHSPSSSQRWDRFAFTIRLEDYAHALGSRVLWLVARFRVDYTYPGALDPHPRPSPLRDTPGPGGEWWDNNQGGNYRVGFRVASDSGAGNGVGGTGRQRREAARSSPGAFPPLHDTVMLINQLHTDPLITNTPPPQTLREHALGLFVPSAPFTTSPPQSPPQATRSSPPSSPPGASPTLRAGRLSLLNYAPPAHAHSHSPVSVPTHHVELSPTHHHHPPQPHSPHYRYQNEEDAHSDAEDADSPASSTLSTPSASPSTVPRVIIGGQPASAYPYTVPPPSPSAYTIPGAARVQDWEWSAASGGLKTNFSGLRVRTNGNGHGTNGNGGENKSRGLKPPGRTSPPSGSPTIPGSGSPPHSGSPSPPHSGSPSPPHSPPNTGPGPGTTSAFGLGSGLPGGTTTSESLYKAFVTQWCFAQGPTAPGAGGGVGLEGGVLA